MNKRTNDNVKLTVCSEIPGNFSTRDEPVQLYNAEVRPFKADLCTTVHFSMQLKINIICSEVLIYNSQLINP